MTRTPDLGEPSDSRDDEALSPASSSPLENKLADIPFARLFQVIWDKGSLARWNQEFHIISEHISQIVGSHFQDLDLGWSAAQSAFRTIVRRLQGEGSVTDPARPSSDEALCLIEGPNALFGYLLMTAFDKAGIKLREDGRAVPLSRLESWGFDPPAPESASDEDQEEASQRWAETINRQVARQYQRLIKRISDAQSSDPRKALVLPILLGHYRLQQVSDIRLSEETGISTVTIRKARKAIVEQWDEEVQGARRALDAFTSKLRQDLDS